MKKLFTTVAVLIVLFSLQNSNLSTSAAEVPAISSPATVSASATQAITIGGDEPLIVIHDETGMVSFIGAGLDGPITLPNLTTAGLIETDQAKLYVQELGPRFGLQNPAEELRLFQNRTLANGRVVVKYQQYYQGIPVLGGELLVNLNSKGELLSMNGEISPAISLTTTPQIDSQEAQIAALGSVADGFGLDQENLTATQPELWVYDERLLHPSARPVELVWRIEVGASDGAPIDALVLVNAATGGISLQFNQVDTYWHPQKPIEEHSSPQMLSVEAPDKAVNTLNFLFGTYTMDNLAGYDRLPGTLLCTHAQLNCTNGSDTHADKVHEYVLDTLQFYYNYHGRNSIDNAGMTVISSVHYSNNYHNAFWTDQYNQMVFGDGDDYPMADDIVAHEFTHGVTSYESSLFYYYQSGAINESLSDIWGEFLDLTNGAGMDTTGVRWLQGEELNGGAIRSMSNPPAFEDPDKMTSTYYLIEEGDLSNFTFDNGGVHTNSGVNNKAAYLMTDGGSFNGYSVIGLGIEKVAAIYYEVQTNMLTSGSDYKDLYYALYQGCLSLLGGVEGITTSDCTQVKKAIDAVEMNLEPVTGYNPEAKLCNPGELPIDVVDIFYDGFEVDDSAWKTASIYPPGSLVFHQWELTTQAAANGVSAYYAMDKQSTYLPGDKYTYAEIDQNIIIPTSGQTYLHFNHLFGFHDGGDDGGMVQYSTDGGSTWIDIWPLFDAGLHYTGFISSDLNSFYGHNAFINNSHGFVSTRYDLNSLAGEADARFRWVLATDNAYYDYGWIIDDVRIYQCVPRVPEKPTLISPTSGTTEPLPNFLWGKLNYTDQYLLTVKNSKGDTVINQWFAQADICSILFCAAASPSSLNSGSYTWTVKGKNAAGQGEFSNSASFTVIGPSNKAAWVDFDGDGDSDITVYRPSNGRWYPYGQAFTAFGIAGDHPVPGDYDGDGDYDVAVYRPSTGVWYLKGIGSFAFGIAGDIPMQCDYDGDGDTDIAIYRPSNGRWYIKDQGYVAYGIPGDIPVPADYDGDGACEVAVYRPSNGRWYPYGMSYTAWGIPGDIPVPGDYDGDGTDDIAIYRPNNGRWYVYGQGYLAYGIPGDIPVPGDYDGDGAFEQTVYRPSNGRWYIYGVGYVAYGIAGDYPVPARDTNLDGDPHE